MKPGAIFHQPFTAQVHISEAEERSSHKRTAGAYPMVGDEG